MNALRVVGSTGTRQPAKMMAFRSIRWLGGKRDLPRSMRKRQSSLLIQAERSERTLADLQAVPFRQAQTICASAGEVWKEFGSVAHNDENTLPTGEVIVTNDKLAIIPLDLSVLCVDCRVISNTSTQTCPACGSGPLLNLACVLDRTPDQEVVFDA